jgi:hypothetical protein
MLIQKSAFAAFRSGLEDKIFSRGFARIDTDKVIDWATETRYDFEGGSEGWLGWLWAFTVFLGSGLTLSPLAAIAKLRSRSFFSTETFSEKLSEARRRRISCFSIADTFSFTGCTYRIADYRDAAASKINKTSVAARIILFASRTTKPFSTRHPSAGLRAGSGARGKANR